MMILIILFSAFVCGVLFEKLMHVNKDIEKKYNDFTAWMLNNLHSLFKKKRNLGIFNEMFYGYMEGVIKKYADVSFGIEIRFCDEYGLPFINIKFVPIRDFNESELEQIHDRIVFAFKKYLSYYGLYWPVVSEYSLRGIYMDIMIYFTEFASEVELIERIKSSIHEKKKDSKKYPANDNDLNDDLNHMKGGKKNEDWDESDFLF